MFPIGYRIRDDDGNSNSNWRSLIFIEANSVEEAIERYEQKYGRPEYGRPECPNMAVITLNRIKAIVTNEEISAEDALTLIRGFLK